MQLHVKGRGPGRVGRGSAFALAAVMCVAVWAAADAAAADTSTEAEGAKPKVVFMGAERFMGLHAQLAEGTTAEAKSAAVGKNKTGTGSTDADKPAVPARGAPPVCTPQMERSAMTAWLLCFFLGVIGAHRMYYDYLVTGCLQMIIGLLSCCGASMLAAFHNIKRGDPVDQSFWCQLTFLGGLAVVSLIWWVADLYMIGNYDLLPNAHPLCLQRNFP